MWKRERIITIKNISSRDGTEIAFDTVGSGPALILVDGALCYRGFGPMKKLAALLSDTFTVFIYDRRGRGESTDVQPYSVEREVQDIASLVLSAGGSAYIAGLSSGAALALHASEAGLKLTKIALYEPPFVYAPGSEQTRIDHTAALKALLASGDRGGAVKYFMVKMVGVPAAAAFFMQMMPMFKKLKAIAHTLPYDSEVMGNFTVPSERLSRMTVPVLIAGGGKSPEPLKNAVRGVAAALPNADLRWLEGQTHNVDPAVLAKTLKEFFTR